MNTPVNQPDASSDTHPSRRRIARILIRDAAIIAVVALVLELLLQWRAPEYGRNFYNEYFTAGYPNAVNDRGFRKTSETDHADGASVLAVGDSVTFGTGVPWQDTWAAQLQHQLDQPGAGGYRVFNAAAPAVRIGDITEGLRTSWKDIEPKVVVLAVTSNMVSLAWIRREEAPVVRTVRGGEPRYAESLPAKAKRMAKSLCLPSFAGKTVELGLYQVGLLHHNIEPAAPYGAMLAHGWRQIGLDDTLSETAWDCFAQELQTLRDVVHERGGVLLVTHVPSRFKISSNLRDNAKAVPLERLTIDPVDRTSEICGRLGVRFVDVAGPLRNERERADGFEPLYLLQDYTHLNRAGNHAVASALKDAVTQGAASPPPDVQNGPHR